MVWERKMDVARSSEQAAQEDRRHKSTDNKDGSRALHRQLKEERWPLPENLARCYD